MPRALVSVAAAALLACSAGSPAGAPRPAAAGPEADYWLIADPEQDPRRSWPLWAARSVPVPVVETLGVDIGRVHPRRPARLSIGGRGVSGRSIPILPDVDRYVFDASVGFRGFEPYQWAFLVISDEPHDRRRHWQVTLRAVPRFEERTR